MSKMRKPKQVDHSSVAVWEDMRNKMIKQMAKDKLQQYNMNKNRSQHAIPPVNTGGPGMVQPQGGVATSPSIPMKIMNSCDVCGAAVFPDKVTEHEEWHAMVTEAIREQVEEAMAQERKDAQDFNKALAYASMEATAPKLWVPSDPTAVLGRCIHGVDLDKEFCPEGCRV